MKSAGLLDFVLLLFSSANWENISCFVISPFWRAVTRDVITEDFEAARADDIIKPGVQARREGRSSEVARSVG